MSRIIRTTVWADEPCIVEVKPLPSPVPEEVEDEVEEEEETEEDIPFVEPPELTALREELAKREADVVARVKAAEEHIRETRQVAESEIHAAREAVMAECSARKKEADELLNNTKADCAVMRSETERERKEILSDAHEQAEAIFAEAKKNGHKEGVAEGRREGEAKIREEQKQIILDANKKAEKTLADAKEACQLYVDSAENIIASLAMEIADKVLPQHFIDVPQVVLPLVRAAILKVQDQPEVDVKVSPDNYDLVLLARSEFQGMLEGNATLEVHSDENLGPGDVILETPNGNVDARLSTQLDIVKKAIRDVMK